MNKVSFSKTAVLLFAFFSVGNLFAQTENDKRNMINVYVAPGNHIIRGGGGTLPGIWAFSYGIIYLRQLSERRSLYTGFEYTHRLATSNDVGFVTIPVQFKRHFGNRFFLNHGLLFDINIYRQYKISIENGHAEMDTEKYDIKGRFGMGYGVGVGFEHTFDNGISLSLNPFFRLNGLFSDAYVHIGIGAGFGYKF